MTLSANTGTVQGEDQGNAEKEALAIPWRSSDLGKVRFNDLIGPTKASN